MEALGGHHYPLMRGKEENNMRHSIKALTFAVIAAMASAGPALARPDVRTLTCAQAIELVQSSGAIVLSFTNTTYERVVRSQAYCQFSEETESIYVATSDHPRCRIGNKCIDRIGMFDFLWDRD